MRLSGERGVFAGFDAVIAVIVVALGLLYAVGFHSFCGVDLAPVLTLSGLISGTTLLSVSGVLSETARRLAASAGRASPFIFTLSVGLLAGVTLNDAAILVAAPVAVELAELGGADRVTMLAIAAASVNIGSAIGPYGNPQDILILHHYHIPLADLLRFTVPAYLPALLGLSLLSLWLGGAPVPGPPIAVRRRPAILGGSAIVLSVVLSQLGAPWLAAITGVALLAACRSLLANDWGAIALVSSAYIAPRALAVHASIPAPSTPLAVYAVTLALSGAVGNVPAVSLLLGAPWRPLHLGANLAGPLHPYSSMANLLALRVTRTGWRRFTRATLPIAAALALYGLLVVALVSGVLG